MFLFIEYAVLYYELYGFERSYFSITKKIIVDFTLHKVKSIL